MGQGRSATSLAPAALVTTRDYTTFSSFIDNQGFLIYEGQGSDNSVRTKELQVPQVDQGSPNQMPSALGKIFSQGDWSHGQGQPFFDYQSSDPAKFNYSEGFDISKPGVLRHLHSVLTNATTMTGGSGRQAQSQGALYVCLGQTVKKFSSPSAAATTVDPHNGEGATTAYDITAEGDRKYVALGANGIHRIAADDTAAHYSDAAAILVAWVKDRLIACSATALYEITAGGAAPTAKLTLAAGWTFTDIGENGPYVYASAINSTSGQSKVFHFGLDSSLAFVAIGSTWLPNNELVYAFKGYLGITYLGCGRVNASGGKDALLYKATPDGDGFLSYELIAESTGAGSRDLSIKSFATYGRKVLCGWTLGITSPYGEREGLAVYDPALDSFSHHLASTLDTATPDPVLGVSVFAGRIVFVTTDALYYEDTTKYVSTATMIPSTGNFRDAGLKNWDQTELATKALPATSYIEAQYSTDPPEQGNWSVAGSYSTTGTTRETLSHSNTEASTFTPKFISHSTTSQADAPEIQTFSVRANPAVAETPFQIRVTVRIFDRDRLSLRGGEVRQNPVTVKKFIEDRYNSWFNYYTADVPDGYYVRLTDYQLIKPMEPIFNTISGEELKNGYVVGLALEGVKN